MEKSNSLKDQQLYGRRTWNLLHSMSAYFPEKPTEEDKTSAREFVELFMEVGIDYPQWGERFLRHMREKDSIDLADRQRFSEWMCRQHNRVNNERGKPEFDCTYENLRKRWGPPL